MGGFSGTAVGHCLLQLANRMRRLKKSVKRFINDMQSVLHTRAATCQPAYSRLRLLQVSENWAGISIGSGIPEYDVTRNQYEPLTCY
jgi:hypothetical protein